MSELNQLLLNLNQKQNFNYNDFYVSESNYYAFQLIDTWPKWEKNIINIFGENGCGKSHLSEIFKNKYKATILDEKELKNETLKTLKIPQNIILENFKNKTDEKLLYSLFNLVDQDNKFLIINSNLGLMKMNFELIDLKSRINNCIPAEIKIPDDDLIFALILKNLSDKQIKIEKKLIEYIVKRIDRSYRKILEFIYKIDTISLKKKKPINLKTIKEII
ncbi:MAG: DNA replication protein [Rickettsiales bacterium TMED289]|nr:MAG: DNA replication protein [Rickettsiales bacterium TMED289]|tara:strand:- start:8336 stop:8992 length:657 start_codon:yes stop_codon:yes gene_type:complete